LKITKIRFILKMKNWGRAALAAGESRKYANVMYYTIYWNTSPKTSSVNDGNQLFRRQRHSIPRERRRWKSNKWLRPCGVNGRTISLSRSYCSKCAHVLHTYCSTTSKWKLVGCGGEVREENSRGKRIEKKPFERVVVVNITRIYIYIIYTYIV